MKKAKWALITMTSLIMIVVAAACGGAAAPETITVVETVVVEKEVQGETVTVVETVVVEKEVEKVVEVEVPAEPAAKSGTLVIAANKFPSGFEPHVNVAWESLYIMSAVYDTLVYMDPETGNIVPGLATSWEVSDDGTTYTFHLRDDVTFHDGTPFNAEAVKFNLDRMVNPETKSQKAGSLLGPYESSEVIDEYTVQVNLSESYSFLLEGLSLNYTAMYSPAAVEQWGADYAIHQVGTGPFMIKEVEVDDHITLVPNPDYNWAPEFFENQGPPYLEEITWIFLPEPATQLPALEAGDADITLSFPPSDSGQLLSQGNLDLRITNLVGQPLYWFMNVEKSPTDDIRVRKAILYGTDRETAINIVLRGMYPVANGPMTAASAEYNPEVEGMYPYDPEAAKALLEEAGWTDSDGDGIRDKDGEPLTISMILQGWGFIGPLGEVLQAQLREIGINVEAEQLSFPAQMEAAGSGERNMAVMGGSGFFSDDTLSGFFHSSNADGGFNWSKVRDPELDAMLDQGAQTLDPEARQEIYNQVQMKIMEDALILPVYDYVFITGLNDRVQGIVWDRTGLVPYFNEAYIAQ